MNEVVSYFLFLNHYSEGVSILAEMFPDACSLDIEHCLTIAKGDTESAVQLMLLKSERSTTAEKENTQEILDFSPKVHVCAQL